MTEIPANLTNEQIRKLLEKDLTNSQIVRKRFNKS